MIVTYYHPWGYFYPARSGADTMACAHLEYFRGRGFAPRIVVSNGAPAARDAFERQYHWAEDIIVIDTGRRPEIHQVMDTWNLGSHLAAHALLAECPQVKRLLAQPTDLAFFNYVFSTPLLDAIPRNAFRVLESVDLMAHQYVERRASPARFQRLLAAELELYDLYDLVLMINEQEDAHARSRCQTNIAYVPRPVRVAAEAAPVARGDQYDLLFVGSDHPPNTEGVGWFYNYVFKPLLRPQGLRWAIAGSVCNRLPIHDDQVVILGVVDDLDAVYQRSKLVVVPLFRGAGISIKTLEAMGQRKPVVTTPCGRRGLPKEADTALVCRSFEDNPRQVADDILSLCSSAALRARYGLAATEFIDQQFGVEAYGRRMDELLAPLLGRNGPEATVEATLITGEEGALPDSRAAA